jgi:hypothetical protein
MLKANVQIFKIPLMSKLTVPLCHTCKYSKEVSVPDCVYLLCKRFPSVKLSYPLASHCRNDEEKCGILAKEYTP